jgi:hypothetical protein
MINSNLDFEKRRQEKAEEDIVRSNTFLTRWPEQLSSFEGSQAVPIHLSGGGTFEKG